MWSITLFWAIMVTATAGMITTMTTATNPVRTTLPHTAATTIMITNMPTLTVSQLNAEQLLKRIDQSSLNGSCGTRLRLVPKGLAHQRECISGNQSIARDSVWSDNRGCAAEDGEGGSRNINLHGAVLHVIGDLVQSVGVAVAGALIWWNQVRHERLWRSSVFCLSHKQTGDSYVEQTPSKLQQPVLMKLLPVHSKTGSVVLVWHK